MTLHDCLGQLEVSKDALTPVVDGGYGASNLVLIQCCTTSEDIFSKIGSFIANGDGIYDG